MPRRGVSCGGHWARSKSSNSIFPALRRTRPMMARNVVVFPTPLRPSSAAHSPVFTARFTPCRMCSRPMWTWTPSSRSMGGLFHIVFVFFAAEIGLAHPLVRGDLARGPGRENAALGHHGDVVGDFEHHIHVVLDDDDVDRAGKLADLLDRPRGLGRAHATGRLV